MALSRSRPAGAARAWAAGLLLLGTAPAGFAQAAARNRPSAPQPLSAEDAALVKEMALLERLDLLRNLELFERSADPGGDDDEAGPPDPPKPGKARP